jgi:hypothetical protein
MRTLGPIRVQRVDDGSLTALLRKFWNRAQRQGDKIQAQMARDAWLDESYVSRLLSGERDHPSRDALILLGAFGLELAVEEVDELLMAADYKPLVLPASLR